MTPKPRMYAKLASQKGQVIQPHASTWATPRLLGVHTERTQRKDNLTSYSQVIPRLSLNILILPHFLNPDNL